MNTNISIIIPTYNCLEKLQELLISIELQSLQPSEIIIVDSSTDRSIKQFINSKNETLPLVLIESNKKYPGEKRNEGVEYASSEWIAFLDVGTIPRADWLKINFETAIRNDLDIVFGSTVYQALNHFQKLLRAATYGKYSHETTPGTLVKAETCRTSGGFIENIRAGDDQEWRLQLRDISKKHLKSSETTLDYSSLPNSLLDMQKKYFIYYLHGAKVRAQRKVRDIYLSLILIFSSIVITQWNYLIGGWDTNPLFIPNITKIYVLSIFAILLGYILIKRVLYPEDRFNIFEWFTWIFLFFVILYSVLYWNFAIADWDVDSYLFIPHITKIYIASVFVTSLCYRGVYRPLKLGTNYKFLFPKNWLIIGLIGLSLDLVKAPGVILGILLSPFQKNLTIKKN